MWYGYRYFLALPAHERYLHAQKLMFMALMTSDPDQLPRVLSSRPLPLLTISIDNDDV